MSISNDYLRINGHDWKIVPWILNKAIRPKNCCEITLRDNTYLVAFPIEVNMYYLKYYEDILNEDNIHFSGKDEKIIAIKDILEIKIISIYKDYMPKDVKEPIYGYKVVDVNRGIIETFSYIYDLGIPYMEPRRNPYLYSFDDIYSHFCLSMEDVYLCFGKNYFQPDMQGDYTLRLFLVKAEGHCFRYKNNGWVSNNLTLEREITQKEIIEYYENRSEILSKIKERLNKHNLNKDIWNEYKAAKYEQYDQITNRDNIERYVIQNCIYKKEPECQQNKASLSLEKCKVCKLINYPSTYESMKPEYSYFICRSDIFDGKFNENGEEYRLLQEKRYEKYKEAIDRCRYYYGKELLKNYE